MLPPCIVPPWNSQCSAASTTRSLNQMDYLQTENILKEIYKEQKTIAKFMDTIFQFLLRHTNFRLINASRRTKLWQIFLDELSPYEPELQTTTERVTASSATSIPAETEIAIELNNVPELDTSKISAKPIIDITSQLHILPNTIQVCSDTAKLKVPKHRKNVSLLRKILPKEKQTIQSTPPANLKYITSKRSKKRLYKCAECAEMFVSFRQLKIHESLHTSQSDDVINVCVYCCSLYANSETLEKHVKNCHENGRYICMPCTKSYKNRGQLLKHLQSNIHNANTLLYYCSLCPRSGKSYVEFTSRAALQMHFQEKHLLMPVSQDEDDVEIEMDEEFLDEFLLNNNVNENSFNFSECWDAFDLNLPDMLRLTNTNNGEATSNVDKCNTSQENETLFKCPICNEGCTSQKLLLRHFAHNHGLATLICNKCDCGFTNDTQLIRHKITHRGQLDASQNTKRNLQCEICDKILKSNASLNYHVRTHLRSFMQAPHECPYCQKHFHSDTNIKKHILTVHSHIKRHICELCDKPFATLDHLKKHVLSQHQNERKHICHVCNKSFTQLCHLKQHLAIHMTGKPYQCPQCEGKFWRKIDLRHHMLKRHS
ncbi:zinc finger protein 502-like [Eurosta solidaginis]|uniref:zinc finger protein 502-like n=1 Tax=Eurosta solidaginis TaxID=178769 RepID=UPI0035313E4A